MESPEQTAVVEKGSAVVDTTDFEPKLEAHGTILTLLHSYIHTQAGEIAPYDTSCVFSTF